MQSAKRVILIPPKNNQVGMGNSEELNGAISLPVEKSTDKIKSKIYDKIHRFIKIILKIAKTVGYDEDSRIKLKNGEYLKNSNIVDLLTHAMSAGKVLHGENEFIELLADSDVDPSLILNENVKAKLIRLKNSKRTDKNNKNSDESLRKNDNIELAETEKGLDKSFVSGKETEDYDRGNKKIMISKEGASGNLKRRLLEDDEEERGSFKRRKDDISDDEDTIDDELIDNTRWKINKIN